jgi:hypothetical protein
MEGDVAMENESKHGVASEERRQQWREHVDRQARSGQSIRAYCEEAGVKVWQLAYWRQALRPKAAAGGFVELRGGGATGVELELAGCRVRVQRGFDPALLREVVAALRAG